MRNSQRFTAEVAARSKVENAWNCTQEYLVLIPEEGAINDYQYSAVTAQADSSNKRSNTVPRQSSSHQDITVLPRSLAPASPFSDGHQHMNGHLTSVVQMRQLDTDDDEGYVNVNVTPQPPKSPKPLPSPPKSSSPLKSSPNRSVPLLRNVPSGAKPLPLTPKPSPATKPLPETPTLKPMSLQQTSPEPNGLSLSSFERSNSDSNEYYNIHFRPAAKKLTNRLSSSTSPTHNYSPVSAVTH